MFQHFEPFSRTTVETYDVTSFLSVACLLAWHSVGDVADAPIGLGEIAEAAVIGAYGRKPFCGVY